MKRILKFLGLYKEKIYQPIIGLMQSKEGGIVDVIEVNPYWVKYYLIMVGRLGYSNVKIDRGKKRK